jgi:hypothetical protein
MAPYLNLGAADVGTEEHRCSECSDLERCLGICPAVDFAMTKDIGTMDERQCQLARIEHRAVDRIEARLAGSEAYRRFVEDFLLKVYTPGGISAELAAFVSRVKTSDADRLADRAGEILERLSRQREPQEGGRG